ncbi:thiamine pyrophosphate-binding protein [Aeromicrobium sp. CTD01-1L150]|uniref:thiamine pyrophosphate-binding protein n=1 Tax=Aeromicrobium sp. CTD01-1L150 TaxID=3341830 RepID=UPI0035C173FC
MKVYEQVSALLHAHGVDTMFGLMGDANMYVSTTFENSGGRFVRVAHEAGAIAMGDGYARLGRRSAVATVTHGPGFTNAITPMVEAMRSGTPLLCLTGDTPAEATHPQRLDIEGVCASLGITHERVHSPDSVARDVNRAWRRLDEGPVVLNVPLSLCLREAIEGGAAGVVRRAPAGDDGAKVAEAIDEALGIVASAARPAIVAGQGATTTQAEAAIAELADLLGAPLFTTALGRGLFADHDRLLGIMGSLSNELAVSMISDSDCIIAFGASLNKYTTMGGELVSDVRLVQVDNDVTKLGWLVEPDERILGDAALVARAMAEQLREAGQSPRTSWDRRAREVAAAVRAWRPSDDRSGSATVDVRVASQKLNEVLEPGSVIVSDVGRFVAGVWPYLDRHGPGDFAALTGFASIGLGLAAGIGAAIARPQEPVVVLAGDGGFMMHAGELSTAVRERLPIVVIVFNDGAYGAEYHKLVAQGLSPTAAYNQWPDLCDMARGLGAQAMSIRSEADVTKLGEVMATLEGPIVVDVRIDPTHHIEF